MAKASIMIAMCMATLLVATSALEFKGEAAAGRKLLKKGHGSDDGYSYGHGGDDKHHKVFGGHYEDEHKEEPGYKKKHVLSYYYPKHVEHKPIENKYKPQPYVHKVQHVYKPHPVVYKKEKKEEKKYKNIVKKFFKNIYKVDDKKYDDKKYKYKSG